MVSFRVHMQPLSRVKQSGCFKLVACHQLLGWSKKKKSAIMITLSRNCRGNSETQREINLKCNLPELLELVWPLYCKNCFGPWDDHISSWSRFGFTDLTSEFKVLRVNSEDVSMPVELGQGKGRPIGRAFLLKPLFTAVIKVASWDTEQTVRLLC